jgi:hypothetical protein
MRSKLSNSNLRMASFGLIARLRQSIGAINPHASELPFVASVPILKIPPSPSCSSEKETLESLDLSFEVFSNIQ